MSDSPKQTILEDGTEFDGSVKSKCPITVSGKLKGEVIAPSLTITPSGSVHGQVKVSHLKSQGELAGKVNDQTTIRASSLEVMLNQPGSKLQVTFGNCELQVGNKAANNDAAKNPPAATPAAPAPPTPPAAPKAPTR